MKNLTVMALGFVISAIFVAVAESFGQLYYAPDLPLATFVDWNIWHETLKMGAYDGTLHFLVGICILGSILTLIGYRALFARRIEWGQGFEVII